MEIISGHFFEIGVHFQKMQEDGSKKPVLEKYVFDAISFTEAESRANEEFGGYSDIDMRIKSEAFATYSDIILCTDEHIGKFYKTKIQTITYDEKTMKEKRSNVVFLVESANIKNVPSIIEKEINNMYDYEIVSIQSSKIIDVYRRKRKEFSDEVQ